MVAKQAHVSVEQKQLPDQLIGGSLPAHVGISPGTLRRFEPGQPPWNCRPACRPGSPAAFVDRGLAGPLVGAVAQRHMRDLMVTTAPALRPKVVQVGVHRALFSMGTCFSASAEACWPTSTSCCGENTSFSSQHSNFSRWATPKRVGRQESATRHILHPCPRWVSASSI